MRDDDFEWDDAKAASNLRKLKVSFDTARLAFEDPEWFELDEPDPDEVRYRRFCVHDEIIYVVVYTERHTRIRIISARRANTYEQKLYNES